MMDKQHKEELEQNDLKEFLTHLDRFFSKHGKLVFAIVLLTAAAVFAARWYRTKDIKALDGAWSDIAAATTPASLASAAQTHSNLPGASNFALLAAANLWYDEVVNGVAGDTPDATQPRLSPQRLEQLTERVKPLYEQVINAPQAHEPSLPRLNARLGLAATLTTLGEFDQARAQYDLVIKEAGEYRALADHAEAKKAQLKSLVEPIVFAEPEAPLPGLLGPMGDQPFPELSGEGAPAPFELPTTKPAEAPAETPEAQPVSETQPDTPAP